MNEKKDIFDRLVHLKIFRWFEPFYKEHKEVLLYLFFGGTAFFLSMFLFWLFADKMEMGDLIGNLFCWVICVLYQYITNRTWVFDGKTNSMGELVKQIASFFGGRIFTLFVEEAILFIFIDIFGFNDMLIKLIAQVVIIVLNYIISKLFVFKKAE